MNLSTKYLGLPLKNPFVPGASPLTNRVSSLRELEDHGAAAVVLASLFEEQITAKSPSRRPPIAPPAGPGGEAPAPLGLDDYLALIRDAKSALGIPVIASLNACSASGWIDHARDIQQAGADALELNLYLLPTNPAFGANELEQRMVEVVAAVRSTTSLPLAVKLAPFFTALPHTAQRLRDAGAGAVVLFNRFYEPDINVRFRECAPRLELSDSSELLLRLRWLAILSSRVPVDLAVTGGVHTPNDAIKAILAGARCVQVVSTLLRHGPPHLRTLIAGLTGYLEEQRFKSPDDLRGALNLARTANPDAYERANYVQSLQLWEQ